MNKIFIALALILAVVSASKSLSSETKARLQKINTNSFGKTILETIQVELQSKDDPRPRIVTLLQELEQELITDQQEADEDHEGNVESNDAILAAIDEELESLGDSLSAWEEQQEDLEDDLAQNRADLATQADLLDTYNAELDAATAARETNQDTWETQDAKYGRLLDVLGRVRAVITERLASRYNSEFIQTSHKQLLSNLAEVKETINSKAFKKSSPGFAKLANFIAVKVENTLRDAEDDDVEALFTTIVTVIDSLAAGIEAERTAIKASNEADEAAFEETSGRLNNAISTATASIDNLDNLITDQAARLATVTGDIAGAASRVDELNEQRVAQVAAAQQLENAYREATHDRTEQLQLIQEVLEIVQNQLSGLRQYAEDYLGNH